MSHSPAVLDRIPRRTPENNPVVYDYIKVAVKLRDAREALAVAEAEVKRYERDVYQAWQRAKTCTPGIYSFREFGRLAIVVPPTCPPAEKPAELLSIVP